MSRYVKEIFEPQDLEYAKHVVLTSDPNNPNKFKYETDFLIKRIRERNIIDPESLVLDFGCGMGRVSKNIVETFGCRTIGLDFSETMLRHARTYVGSNPLFETCQTYSTPNSVDVVVCTFVLQHVEDPVKEISSIYNMLKPQGWLVVVNENHRLVPLDVQRTQVNWVDDKFDVHGELTNKFETVYNTRYMNTETRIIFYRKKD